MFEDSTHGGRHQLRYTEFQGIFISTHALTEGDITSIERNIFFNIFQLTPSRRATLSALSRRPDSIYFNSRPHGGRLESAVADVARRLFQFTPSRRATGGIHRLQITAEISTHALTEGDIIGLASSVIAVVFQLTPSRRATRQPDNSTQSGRNFNSRPHGGRRVTLPAVTPAAFISTHALTEGDLIGIVGPSTTSCQLTPSRRATRQHVLFQFRHVISTHALTEGDHLIFHVFVNLSISTHALTEGDTYFPIWLPLPVTFQLTPSRRAT